MDVFILKTYFEIGSKRYIIYCFLVCMSFQQSFGRNPFFMYSGCLPVSSSAERESSINNTSHNSIKCVQYVQIMSDVQDKTSSGKEFFDDIRAWQQTFDAIPDLILVINKNNRVVLANKAVERKFSLERKDIIGKPCYEIMHCTEKPPSFCPHPTSLKTGEELFSEAYDEHLKGFYRFSATPLFNTAGQRIGTVEVGRDISDRKQTEDALKESESIFRSITESATDAIVSIDRNDTIVLWNQTAEKMFGLTAAEVIGHKLTSIMPDKYRAAHRKGISRFLSTGKPKLVGRSYEVTAIKRDGTEFPVELSLSSWERKEEIFFTAIIRDITIRRHLEQKLREASLTDELTGLLNRRGFMTLSEKQLLISKRHKRRFSILFLDLNDMKQINDSFGHKAGDQALIEVADILKKTFRSSDIIARIGGDEFTILINEPIPDADKVITDHFIQNLQALNDRSAHPYTLSTSLGISHFDPAHPSSIDDLLAEADKLMYEHKSRKSEDTAPDPSGKDKRKAERISTGNDYVAELIVSDSSMIRNISNNGICVDTPYMLKKDNIYSVKIHAKNNEIFSQSAVVIWSASMRKAKVSSSDRFETGLMFLKLDTTRKHALNSFIKNLPSA